MATRQKGPAGHSSRAPYTKTEQPQALRTGLSDNRCDNSVRMDPSKWKKNEENAQIGNVGISIG